MLGACDAVLSGYLGSADIGHAVAATVARVRAANADAVYCCDPVIGDVGRGVFVRPGIEEFMREVAVPIADVVTPNHFELDLLSGYLGSADIGHAVVGTVARVRAANPAAVYCCDPVIGDVGRGVFVRPGIEEFMRDVAVPAADVVTPNHFELDLLSGTPTTSLDAVKDAVTTVQGLGPRVVLTTSLVTDDTPDDSVDLLASEGGRHFRVRTPRLDVSVNGAGDAIAALFLAHWLDTRSAAESLGRAAASVFGLLQRTEDAGSREILLVAAQDEFVSPSRTFAVDEV